MRIDPQVDFACKMMLGSPEHPSVTIHFLNSLLSLQVPVVEVEILNPIVGKERAEEKMIVLDVLARDGLGRLFNIEMQTRLLLAFSNRLLFYNCKNYARQLRTGEEYEELCPAISICILNRRLFPEAPQVPNQTWHHSFRLRCDQDTTLVLSNDFEFHIFELPKFHASAEQVKHLPPAQKWLYLFKYGAVTDLETLSGILTEEPFQEALGVLEMISKTPEDYQYYEDRLKSIRDEKWLLNSARREGEKLGEERGEERGEKRGLELGLLVGKIQALQAALLDPVSPEAELLARPQADLKATLAELQSRLQSR